MSKKQQKETQKKKCAICGEVLDQENNCVNGCTENPLYMVAEGYEWDHNDPPAREFNWLQRSPVGR